MKLYAVVFSFILGLIIFVSGFDYGRNSNKIKHMDATVYRKAPTVTTLSEDIRCEYTKFPIYMSYSIGTGESKIPVDTFTASGKVTETKDSRLTNRDDGKIVVTPNFDIYTFQAMIAKASDGTPYKWVIMVSGQKGGSLQMTEEGIQNRPDQESAYEELKKVAKLIISRL